MKLTEFLLARIAEDTRRATGDEDDTGMCDYMGGVHLDPQRARAECEAKRRIVERVGFLIDEPDGLGNLCEGILMDLALPYADHPDFREEWRVS